MKERLRRKWQKSISDLKNGQFNAKQGNPSYWATVCRGRGEKYNTLFVIQEIFEEEGFNTKYDRDVDQLYIEWPNKYQNHPKMRK